VSLVRDLYLTDLRAVLIVDDKDIEAVLTMLHYIGGDNQDVGSDAGLLAGVDEIPLDGAMASYRSVRRRRSPHFEMPPT
jgi:hypothetical protein